MLCCVHATWLCCDGDMAYGIWHAFHRPAHKDIRRTTVLQTAREPKSILWPSLWYFVTVTAPRQLPLCAHKRSAPFPVVLMLLRCNVHSQQKHSIWHTPSSTKALRSLRQTTLTALNKVAAASGEPPRWAVATTSHMHRPTITPSRVGCPSRALQAGTAWLEPAAHQARQCPDLVHAEVWSPSGGWWPDPKGWRRNTAIAVGYVQCRSSALESLDHCSAFDGTCGALFSM